MVTREGRPARGIVFKISFEGKPSKELKVNAYAFDRRGTFIKSAPVKEGQVTLDISEAQARRARIFFGPPLEGKREQPPTIRLMERLHAYEPRFDFESEKRVYELMPVLEVDWGWWLWCSCRVRGQVVRPVTSHGVTTDMPVCHARVHICEVDPLWLIIQQLPDHLIFKIRDYLITEPPIITKPPIPPPPLDFEIKPPFPKPPPPELGPEPIFQFDPAEMDFTPEKIARMNRPSSSSPTMPLGSEFMFNPQPEPPLSAPVERMMATPQPESSAKSLFSALPAATKAALQSRSLPTVKKALLTNINLIWPYLCWWPWIWPYLYISDELAVLETDAQGRFDTTIWYPCFGDHPDLYFWVEFCIGGAWTTVYRPHIYCSTYWQYACGSEVTIRITDPRVPWCGDPIVLPGLQVAVVSIGNDFSPQQIEDSGVEEGLTTDGRPFGGSLEPHVWFGVEDLVTAGIRYYRWSYRRLGVTDGWHAMDRQVVRHYAEIGPAPSYTLTFKPFVLGPQTVNTTPNLFQFQPKDPPAGGFSWAPMIAARENTASAFFRSHLLEGGDADAAAGKYELKLELFDTNGSLVNLTDAGVVFKVPTVDAPFGQGEVPTTVAPVYYLIKDGNNKVIGFRLVLHVDNNPCEAVINETQVGLATAGDCGFIDYPTGASALISFKARHPNDFATFNFGLYRGSAGEIIDVSGPVGNSPISYFVRDAASVFSRDVPITDLVSSCPGDAAAFAETLYVWAMATDGWSRLYHLDAHAVPKAFALRPE